MSVDIGNRLRHLRSMHKLSQRELARRAGVTNSTISLIESNSANPSVGALKRILDGIPFRLRAGQAAQGVLCCGRVGRDRQGADFLPANWR
ncbi:helix-turn-helix transcriptional regulator [Agrobacterium cavarae]|uniref:helix-turn-helix transcriptional regulator n=1 Tax=Agrobacterium cavarae TaxID=2528239 RepID=UPI00406CF9E4